MRASGGSRPTVREAHGPAGARPREAPTPRGTSGSTHGVRQAEGRVSIIAGELDR